MRQILSAVLVLFCWLPGAFAFGEDEPTENTKPYLIVLQGAPGSGRASIAVRLRRDFSFPAISLTTLLANHVLEGTALGTKCLDYFINGGEMPKELVPALLYDRLLEPDCSRGVLLEDLALPNPQVLELEKRLDSKFHLLIINIAASDEWLIQRAQHRLVCYKCGYVYDEKEMGKKQKTTCDICGSPLQQRQEDSPEVIKARLAAYHAQLTPLFDLFKKDKHFVQIPGDRRFEETYQDVLHTIEQKTGLVPSKIHADSSGLLGEE